MRRIRVSEERGSEGKRARGDKRNRQIKFGGEREGNMMTPLMVSWRRAAFSASAAVSLACCLPVVDMAVLDSSIDHGMVRSL